MDVMPPSHGPADRTVAAPPADLPDVAESVTGRARDLHRLADLLSTGAGAGGEGAATSPAVALLRAHAGAVDDLAEHLLAAGSSAPGTSDGDFSDSGPSGATDRPGPPRSAG